MKNLLIVFTFVGILFFNENSFAQDKNIETKSVEGKPIITFVELGSVNCIPCKAMQPIMKSVEKKYGEQLKVIFYDVWKDDQKKYAEKYGIRLIPTQVFINDKGKEIYRHEGFFPEAELDKFFQSKGLKVKLSDVKND